MEKPATTPSGTDVTKSFGLIAIIVFHAVLALIFLMDVIADFIEAGGVDLDLGVEFFATIGLIAALAFEVRALVKMLRRQAHIERGLSIAAGALHELMEEYFRDWGLTTAEEDVAAFTIKGFSIAEIAELRGTREGTIKTQLNAIYRKAGVSGRGQLLSLLIEDLMSQPLIGGRKSDTDTPAT